ncbi:uncharacterized protein LOC121238163 [Juglans microcarpa x Juglans regia]|uniref:uncharacterized protein LOC121238163 n=1 Tax=Juglans microcarpa x Juglans regia TaxID=2249226 RepID=UPI001B7E145E|nr:uncharacterized protein LOC121238163 [Juglans microcarpa x Juglans regia]
MSCLSWNCWGLGNSRTVRELHLLVKNKAPNFVFLMETKFRRNKVERIKNFLKMENSFIVECRGLSGGLTFLWKEEIDAVLESYTQHHISLKVKNSLDGKTWILTGFYGDPITAKRQGSWQLLRRLKPANDLGWLCVGDFNEIVSTNEKSGGMMRPCSQMESFREALEECEPSDIGFVGNKYTSSNNRYGAEFTIERLDRGLCNAIWTEWNPRAMVLSLTALNSDHCPLLISKDNPQQDISSHTKPFRYEVSWAQREACNKLITEEWSRPRLASNKLNYVIEGLKRCQFKLQQWSKQAMSGSKKEVKHKLLQINILQKCNQRHMNERIKVLKKEVVKLLEEENLKWKQRAKQKWLKEGDRNTKYFHQCASQRSKVNRVIKLFDDTSQEITNAAAICQQFQDFFQDLFTTSCPQNIDGCLAATRPKVTEEMNQDLKRPYTAQEIEEALFQMDGLSSPGPDGYPAAFFQQHWNIVGRQVSESALFVLNSKRQHG